MHSSERELRHVCEVCGTEANLTPSEAFILGWDYPPQIGQFGVVGPRCCPDCPNVGTAWWALAIDGFTENMLTDQQRATIERIEGEPESIAVEHYQGSDASTESTVEKLSPAMGGVWLVVSQGSQHMWDLDSMTYTRVPGATSLSGEFSMDGQPIPIARVERWPQVGSTSLFFFEDPNGANCFEHYRQSSRIESITRVIPNGSVARIGEI